MGEDALSERLTCSCKFTFRINEKGKHRRGKTPEHVLRKKTDIEETFGVGYSSLPFSGVSHVIPFLGGTKSKITKTSDLSQVPYAQSHHIRETTGSSRCTAQPSPQFSALERGGWLHVSKGWEMVLLQQVAALGAHSHSCTSQISESRGGSFLSCSRRAKTCSEWTLLRVRRLTSFINIRGNIRWSFGLWMQM